MESGPVNSFTDADPQFPYQSSEAKSQLGIPDSPAVHLAITDLAERLLALPHGGDRSPGEKRTDALRNASWGARENHCFELVVLRYRMYSGEHVDQAECDRVSAASVPTNWLGAAIARLKAEGIDVAPAVRRQATRYGWVEAV